MKKNKYRWREMKDEKPKFQEWIFCIIDGENKYPIRAQYFFEKDSKFAWISFLEDPCAFPVLCEQKKIKWRKMCKLPGDK